MQLHNVSSSYFSLRLSKNESCNSSQLSLVAQNDITSQVVGGRYDAYLPLGHSSLRKVSFTLFVTFDHRHFSTVVSVGFFVFVCSYQ